MLTPALATEHCIERDKPDFIGTADNKCGTTTFADALSMGISWRCRSQQPQSRITSDHSTVPRVPIYRTASVAAIPARE